MEWPSGNSGAAFSIHGASAFGAFACLALVAWFTAGDTLALVVDETRRQWYERLYKFLAVLLVASPVIVYVLSLFLEQRRGLVLAVKSQTAKSYRSISRSF